MASFLSSMVLIYMGGTLGCIGKPLHPLPASQFLPLLQQLSQKHFPSIQHFVSSQSIRDSSQLTPQDWQQLIIQIESFYHQGYQKILIIHGTDTLAYTAAFLADYFAITSNHTLQIVMTGSQYPLLDADGLQLASSGDAFNNLYDAYHHLFNTEQTGCWVAFDQHIWSAHTVQKIHTTALPAFTGRQVTSPLLSHPTDIQLAALVHLNIAIHYVLPVALEQQALQLQQILQQPKLQAIIILAFGAGNMAQHSFMENVLQQAYNQQILVVLASQVPFGGVTTHYAAGHWLSDFGVLSAGQFTIPAIYSHLALLFCQNLSFVQRQQAWQHWLTHAQI